MAVLLVEQYYDFAKSLADHYGDAPDLSYPDVFGEMAD